jgi:peptide chain release factor subunit 3
MGTFAVGKLESGQLRKADTLLLMPNKDEVEIAAIYNELEDEVNLAAALLMWWVPSMVSVATAPI